MHDDPHGKTASLIQHRIETHCQCRHVINIGDADRTARLIHIDQAGSQSSPSTCPEDQGQHSGKLDNPVSWAA